jgi:predicted RNA-binding Zn-ribbon protein involved in translation (DUF1610 family)
VSHSCDEAYSIYDERQLRANKPHECEACGLEIRPGDTYTRAFVLFNGRKEHYKRCARCQLLHEHLRTLAPGDMWPDEQLGCGTLYSEEWGPPPAWVSELAFWRPGDPLPSTNLCADPRVGNIAMRAQVSIEWHGRKCTWRSEPRSTGTEVCS